MSKTIDLLNQARSVLNDIMSAEGEFTEEHEKWLQHYLKESQDQAEWLGHLYRRAKSEADMAAAEVKRLMAVVKKANNTKAWARESLLQFLVYQEELGEPTSIAGVCHLSTATSLELPEDSMDYPVEFLVEQAPRLDRVALKKALKTKEIPGCRLVKRRSVVMR